MLTTAYRDLLK